jgi:protein glucosyltransferase
MTLFRFHDVAAISPSQKKKHSEKNPNKERKHYGPIDLANKCHTIKLAVDWGNAHPGEARCMGQEGSGFARGEMDMKLVYKYMMHMLMQYTELLRYKPTMPKKAVELCPESMACTRSGREREFMMEFREKYIAGCKTSARCYHLNRG